jgi:hypothetical protein
VLTPGDEHRAADPIDVADRAVFMLQRLVQAHVIVARAQPHGEEVVDARNHQRRFDNRKSRERNGREVSAGRMAADDDLAGKIPK